MKNSTILSIFLFAAMSLLAACDSKQTTLGHLKDDGQRKMIMTSIAHNQAYMNEMMNEMMKNDSCKMMMSHSMMNDPSMHTMMMDNMMAMCKKDPTMCKMMMDKTMAMCDADTAKCNMMMGAMKPHPNVMKSMKGMCDMKGMGDMKMMPKK